MKRSFSEEHRRKLSVARRKRVTSVETRKKLSETNKRLGRRPPVINYWLGKKRSEADKRKMSEAKRGAKAPNWKGGVTKLKHSIRDSYKFRDWRFSVFKRDNFTCQYCDDSKIYLEAHHIKRYSKIIEENNIKTLKQAIGCNELWNIGNGITLCQSCHKKTDTWGWKAQALDRKRLVD